jgi:hypothetical protein
MTIAKSHIDLQPVRKTAATTDPRGAGSTATPTPSPDTAAGADPYLQRIADLRSGDANRVRLVLADRDAVGPDLAQHIVPLLAWDEVCIDVIKALQGIAAKITGQLLDTMLDTEEEFAIRRRIPRVLCVTDSRRAVEGLLKGLEDRRFEVRYQSGRALRIMRNRTASIVIDREQIVTAVRREAAVSRRVWQSQRLLDRVDDHDALPFADEVLRTRTNRSLEHVFTILSLVLPAEPLRIAYRGLHTDDRALRGTALEYLESVLPPDIRERLWPLIEGGSSGGEFTTKRPHDEVLADLLRSHQSIEMNLVELRKKHSSPTGKGKGEE